MTRFSRTNRLVQSPSSPSVPYLACSHDSNRDNPLDPELRPPPLPFNPQGYYR